MSDYLRFERSRNARLWITEVVIPLVGIAVVVASNPASREFVTNAGNKLKNKIKKVFM